MTAVILDLDGTLVDSVPAHVVCWHDAFTSAGLTVPTVRIRDAIGLSSDRLIRHLLGRIPDAGLEEELTSQHSGRFLERADMLRPTPGAEALLADLADREVPFVVATAAGSEEREALMACLGDPEVDVTDADDDGRSKPDPDPVRTAAAQIGAVLDTTTTMVGDSPWDGHAAVAAGVRFVAVRCGGFPDAALREAAAARVADDPAALIGTL